jgi:hypothetical protein
MRHCNKLRLFFSHSNFQEIGPSIHWFHRDSYIENHHDRSHEESMIYNLKVSDMIIEIDKT